MASRPIRERRQPKRDEDKVSRRWNLGGTKSITDLKTVNHQSMGSLIQRKGVLRDEGLPCSKLLANFINAANQSITSLS